jgi:phosphate transport system substrate-binding protein
MAGVVLASGIYFTQRLQRSVSIGPPTADTPRPTLNDPTSPAPMSVREDPPKAGKPPTVAHSPSTVPDPGVRPSRLGIAATVSAAPIIKEGARFFKTNLDISPTLGEPAVSVKSSDAIFASLCGAADAVQVVVADRRIHPDEVAACRVNQRHIAEVKIGYEAIAIVNSNLYARPRLTARALFLALAHEVPDPENSESLIPNPYVTWDQIDPTLPNDRIDVLGPPASSATGMAFRDSILEQGCASFPAILALKASHPEQYETECGLIRTDGYFRTTNSIPGSADNPFAFAGYLQANPGALALVAYSALSGWNFNAASIDDVIPTRETIKSGAYASSRTLYVYVNKLTPIARNFAFALWSVSGYPIVDSVMIPLDRAEQRVARDQVLALPEL